MADTDLYDTDAYTWAQEQADLLRRMAAGEHVNDQVDWTNIIEEIESVGRSELRAATSALTNAMQHKLYLLGWPNSLSVRHWQGETEVQLLEMIGEYRASMRQEIEKGLPRFYQLARARAERHMVDEPLPALLPTACPWTLDELLAEARAIV